MNFYIVFTKNRKKFDKYVKNNRIRNKVIIDVQEIITVESLDIEKYREYLSMLILTRITQGLKKSKDIYYLPNFKTDFNVKELFKLKKLIDLPIDFSALVFYNEISKDDASMKELYNNMNSFVSSQIIQGY